MTASKQARIEFCAPDHLRHAIIVLVEMGPRPYRELMCMRKEQVDLENRVVHIPDSKTPNGVADMPMKDLARAAFKAQLEATPGSDYVFPSPSKNATKPHILSLRTARAATLRRAGVKYFSLYERRHAFATRLSAGGVAGHFVTQLLRQGDPSVFKRYSQAKLAMMHEALTRLDRQANEHAPQASGIPLPN